MEAFQFGEQGVVKNITFRVGRFDPDRDTAPYIKEYVVPANPGMTVLEGLYYIKENLDGTLAYRCSCRMGICGSCGMFINGFPRLACNTQISSLGEDMVEVKPLPNYMTIKDLIPDLEPLFQKHRAVKPYIVTDDETPREFIQTPAQLEEFLQFSYCLKCGLCLAACPTVATDREFTGPQALAQAYRYCADNRDNGKKERLRLVDGSHGVWRCHLAGACADVCPKGVDPALAIQLLKRETAKSAWGFGTRQKKAPVAGTVADVQRRPNIPDAPQKTV